MVQNMIMNGNIDEMVKKVKVFVHDLEMLFFFVLAYDLSLCDKIYRQ